VGMPPSQVGNAPWMTWNPFAQARARQHRAQHHAYTHTNSMRIYTHTRARANVMNACTHLCGRVRPTADRELRVELVLCVLGQPKIGDHQPDTHIRVYAHVRMCVFALVYVRARIARSEAQEISIKPRWPSTTLHN
jgi:hypothetical protein